MNRYSSLPPLPDRIGRLAELATDLWWSWNRYARILFRRLDYAVWRSTAHNPVRMLWVLPTEKLSAAASDPEILRLYDRSIDALDAARSARQTWWSRALPHLSGHSIAYFSAEFALHQSLPIYAGGLGVLAGDHCKEASDLGVPLIGVGFMYPQGYFHQQVSAEGWRSESYERLNWADTAIEPASWPTEAVRDRRPLDDRSVLGRLARPHGTREAPCWTPTSRKTRLGSIIRTSLRRRSRNARPAGNHPRHRRRPSPPRPRLRTGGVPSQRRPRCVRRAPADSGSIETGSSFDAALEEIRQTTVFTTHTRCRPATTPSPFISSSGISPAAGHAGPNRHQFLALGAHDAGAGAQFT
jgi:starch phosphorylase